MKWVLIRKSALEDLQAAEAAYENSSTVLSTAAQVDDLLERAGGAIIEHYPGRSLRLIEEARKLVAL